MLQFGLGSCHGQSGRSQYLSKPVPLYPLLIYPYPHYIYIYPYCPYPYIHIHIHIIHIHRSISLLVFARAMGSQAGRSTCGLLWSSVPLGPLYHGCHDNDELVLKMTILFLCGIIIQSICALEIIATIYATANSPLGVDLRKFFLCRCAFGAIGAGTAEDGSWCKKEIYVCHRNYWGCDPQHKIQILEKQVGWASCLEQTLTFNTKADMFSIISSTAEIAGNL